jgi:hypothetical protein
MRRNGHIWHRRAFYPRDQQCDQGLRDGQVGAPDEHGRWFVRLIHGFSPEQRAGGRQSRWAGGSVLHQDSQPGNAGAPCGLPGYWVPLWVPWCPLRVTWVPGSASFTLHGDKCQAIMEDVDKLDNIQDGFIHYQLIRFCPATRLQYLNGHIQLAHQNAIQQQHVDHKIVNALLKKGTGTNKSWNQQDRAWVDMRLHESHEEDGLKVTHNTVTRHAESYDQRQVCCLPGHLCPPCSAGLAAGQRPPESSRLGCTPLLHAIAPARGPPSELRLRSAGSSTAPAAVRHRRWRCCQRGRKPSASARRLPGQRQRQTPSAAQPPPRDIQAESGSPPPASSSSQDQQPNLPNPIPTQRRLTQQLRAHWPQIKALRQRYDGTHGEEQRQFHFSQKHKATRQDSTLRVEMNGLKE